MLILRTLFYWDYPCRNLDCRIRKVLVLISVSLGMWNVCAASCWENLVYNRWKLTRQLYVRMRAWQHWCSHARILSFFVSDFNNFFAIFDVRAISFSTSTEIIWALDVFIESNMFSPLRIFLYLHSMQFYSLFPHIHLHGINILTLQANWRSSDSFNQLVPKSLSELITPWEKGKSVFFIP